MLDWFILQLSATLARKTVEEHRCVLRRHMVDLLEPDRLARQSRLCGGLPGHARRGLDERKTVYNYMCIVARFSARLRRSVQLQPVRQMLGAIRTGQEFRQYDPAP